MATQYVGIDQQTDVYFRTQQGRLKLRISSLSGGQLIPYRRPNQAGPRRADYQVIAIDDPEGLRELLTELLGVHCVVRKQREIFRVDNVRIHLDRVDGLGDFMELEAVFDGKKAGEPAQLARVEHLMRELGVDASELIPSSYETLLSEGAD